MISFIIKNIRYRYVEIYTQFEMIKYMLYIHSKIEKLLENYVYVKTLLVTYKKKLSSVLLRRDEIHI